MEQPEPYVPLWEGYHWVDEAVIFGNVGQRKIHPVLVRKSRPGRGEGLAYLDVPVDKHKWIGPCLSPAMGLAVLEMSRVILAGRKAHWSEDEEAKKAAHDAAKPVSQRLTRVTVDEGWADILWELEEGQDDADSP